MHFLLVLVHLTGTMQILIILLLKTSKLVQEYASLFPMKFVLKLIGGNKKFFYFYKIKIFIFIMEW